MSEIKFLKPKPIPPAGLIKLIMKLGVKMPGFPSSPHPENWNELNGKQKYEYLKSSMLSTENRAFKSKEVAQTYIRRTKRWLDVIELKEPDRVPNFLMCGPITAKGYGLTQKDMFYNGSKVAKAALKFQEEFNPEFGSIALGMSGKAFDILGLNVMRWPGSSRGDALPDNTPYQHIETEVMPAEDYDELIRNPEGYLLRSYYPKIYDGLKGLSDLTNVFSGVEPSMGFGLIVNMGMGPVREALETIFKATDKMIEHMLPGVLTSVKIASQYGTTSLMGGMAFAPFDILGDTLRGTKGIMLDMFRQPDNVLAACEALTPMAIVMATKGMLGTGASFVMIPLHKGADGFMSDEQFEKFYWPSFKAMLLGIIEAGMIPIPFVEGSYNRRLDIIADSGLPKGKTAWWFDRTDMKKAKEKFGSWACIGGNVPSSLFLTGTPQEMEDYCKRVIDICAPGGGYFLAPGAIVDQVNPEVLHTYLDSTKKFGVY